MLTTVQTYIECVVLVSLMITGIYVSFQDGNILSPVRVFVANGLDKFLGKKWSRVIQKPLWDCLACMASLWTIALTQRFDIGLILAVAGLNALIDKWFTDEEEVRYPPVEGFKMHD